MFGYHFIAWASLAIVAIGFLAWGHHFLTRPQFPPGLTSDAAERQLRARGRQYSTRLRASLSSSVQRRGMKWVMAATILLAMPGTTMRRPALRPR